MQTSQADSVTVWDLHTRVFHWSLVALFATVWFSADSLQTVHQWTGYGISTLLVFRLFWGLFGGEYARFRTFIFSPATTVMYLKNLSRGKALRYLGHNPAGAAMIFALLIDLVAIVLSGMSLAATDGTGPFATTFIASLDGNLLKNVHEVFANLMLLLIFGHVSGVILASRLHKENLIKAMLTGRKAKQLEEH